ERRHFAGAGPTRTRRRGGRPQRAGSRSRHADLSLCSPALPGAGHSRRARSTIAPGPALPVEDALELHDTLRTYRLFAGSYDVVFGPIFHPGRKAAVEVANDRPHQRILEVGVGTGLSLPHFRKDARVTGIDVSKEMLAKAHRRVERGGLRQVEALGGMDARAMSFEDDAFDA